MAYPRIHRMFIDFAPKHLQNTKTDHARGQSQECTSSTPPPSTNKVAHSPKVQNRDISGPTKGHLSTKNYLKISSDLTIYKILKYSYFSGEISFIALWFDTTLCFAHGTKVLHKVLPFAHATLNERSIAHHPLF